MLAGRKIGVIGVGNMGTALIRGWLNAGLVKPVKFLLPTAKPRKWKACTGNAVSQAADNRQVAFRADIVLLAVKPQVVPEVLAQLQSRDGRLPLGYLHRRGRSLESAVRHAAHRPAHAGHAQHSHPDPGRHGGGGPGPRAEDQDLELTLPPF